jgi:hypothetical protein
MHDTLATLTVRFEPTISVSERPQTYALDREATGTGISLTSFTVIVSPIIKHLEIVLFL